MNQEDKKENKEQRRFDHQMLAATFRDLGIVDIVDEIKQSLDTRQEEHSQPEAYVPEHQSGFKPVPGVRPRGNHRHCDIGQLPFVDNELGSAKERTDGRPQQDRPQDTVQQQKHLICLFTQQVPFLRLVLVGHGLQDKACQYQHPHPVGSAEAGRIE